MKGGRLLPHAVCARLRYEKLQEHERFIKCTVKLAACATSFEGLLGHRQAVRLSHLNLQFLVDCVWYNCYAPQTNRFSVHCYREAGPMGGRKH